MATLAQRRDASGSGVILLGITGYVTSVAMSMAEHRLLAWQAAQR
jgi:hypothetical protein